jgi:hypothetical protein
MVVTFSGVAEPEWGNLLPEDVKKSKHFWHRMV